MRDGGIHTAKQHGHTYKQHRHRHAPTRPPTLFRQCATTSFTERGRPRARSRLGWKGVSASATLRQSTSASTLRFSSNCAGVAIRPSSGAAPSFPAGPSPSRARALTFSSSTRYLSFFSSLVVHCVCSSRASCSRRRWPATTRLGPTCFFWWWGGAVSCGGCGKTDRPVASRKATKRHIHGQTDVPRAGAPLSRPENRGRSTTAARGG